MNKLLNFLVLVVCTALPLYIIRFEIFGTPSTFLEIIILILFLVWFFEKGLRVRGWLKFINFGDFNYPIVFFLLVALISLILSFDQKNGLGIFKAYFLEPVLLFLVVLERVKSGNGKYPLFGLVLASIWLSITAIFQKVDLFPYPEDAKSEIAQGRIVGVYNSANSLALFLGPIFSLILGWVFTQIGNVKNFTLLFFAISILFLQSLVNLGTKSQAAIFSIGVVCSFVIFSRIISAKNLFKLFQLICILALFLTFFLPIFAFFGGNLGTIFSDITLEKRGYLWQGTVSLIFDHPLFGAGLDGFKELYGESYRLPAYDELLQYPHSLVLTFWTELGFLGVVAFFWILLKFAQKSARNKNLGVGLTAVVIYLLIHGLVDVPYFKNDLSAQFFVLLALTEFRK